MKRILIASTLAVVLCITGSTLLIHKLSIAKPLVVQPSYITYKSPTVEQFLKLTNVERAKVGVPPLKLDERLNKSATRKLDEMETEGIGNDAHIDKAGIHGYTYITDIIPECSPSENLILGKAWSAEQGIKSWMASPAHKAALLDPKFNLVGFAINNDYVVQHFCGLK